MRAGTPPPGARAWTAPVVLGLGPLIRPDLAVLAFAYLVVGASIVRGRGASVPRFVTQALLAPVAYEIFRAGYYGSLLPNPALAKDASGVYWESGRRYLADFTMPYLLWIPAVLLTALGVAAALRVRARRDEVEARERSALVVLGACGVAGLVYGLLVVRGGGDYMHARLLVLPAIATAAPLTVLPLPRRRDSVSIAMLGAAIAVAAWAIISATHLRPALLESGTATSYGYEEERLGAITGTGVAHPIRLEDLQSDRRWKGEAIAAHHREHPGDLLFITSMIVRAPEDVQFAAVPPGLGRDGRTVVIEQAMGVLPYASDLDVLFSDGLGITDAIGARGEAWSPTPGHRKLLTAETHLSRITEPDALIPSDAIPYSPAKLALAREVLHCGVVAELIDATEAPLTPGRFLRNLVGAPARTFLVIPREPVIARAELC
jgi:arabinofuranosyltransferase